MREIREFNLTGKKRRKIIAARLRMPHRTRIGRVADMIIFSSSGIEFDGEANQPRLGPEHSLHRRRPADVAHADEEDTSRTLGHLLAEQLLEAVQVPAVFGQKIAIFAVYEERRDAGHALFLLNCPASRRPKGDGWPGHFGFLHVSEHLGLVLVAADKDHGELGLVSVGELDELRREDAARRAPVGGAVNGYGLILQRSEVDGLAVCIDEAFWEEGFPIKVGGGGEGGAEHETDGGEERFHGVIIA